MYIAGGNTLFENYANRLINEINKLPGKPKDIKVKVHASKDRDIACYIGGTVLCGLNSFK